VAVLFGLRLLDCFPGCGVDEQVSVKIIACGHVQGVSFRWFTLRLAQSLGLVGRVYNADDGNVEVVAEGRKDRLLEFIKRMKVGPPAARVSDVDVTWLPFTGQYGDFEITR
jgi:acylphosphatase